MRTPQTIPFDCFGFEYEAYDSVCKNCNHAEKCVQSMGRRANRIPLSQAVFHLVPDAIDVASLDDNDRPDYMEMFNVCHEKIFGKRSAYTSPFHGICDSDTKLENMAKESRCSVKTFITCAMMGFQFSNPSRVFYPKFLFGKSARQRIDMYREEVIRRFGSFDADSMDDFIYGERSGDTEQKILSSEILTGRWIIGYKMRFSGDPFMEFLRQNEFNLSPIWLAVETRYVPVFEKHLKNPSKSEMLQKHRHAVARIVKAMKTSKGRKWTRARYLFKCRECILPKAVDSVLGYLRLKPSDFEIENKPITDPIRMWWRLGLAIQHIQCLKLARML